MYSQTCQIAAFVIFSEGVLLNTHSICAAVLPFMFYNKLNSMKQSFINKSELTRQDTWSNFLGGRCPEPPCQPWLIVCEIFQDGLLLIFLGDYAPMLEHRNSTFIWVKIITHPSDKSCLCPWL